MSAKRPHPDANDAVARARAAIAEKYAKLNSEHKSPKTASPPPVRSGSTGPSGQAERSESISTGTKLNPDLQRRIDEAKSRAAARTAALLKQQEQERSSDAKAQESAVDAKGGLGVGLHPALAGASLNFANKRNSTRSKFATVIANQKAEPQNFVPKNKRLELLTGPGDDFTDREKNPYFDHKLGGRDTTRPADRRSKSLRFNAPGKFIDKANQIRSEQSLKELRARIAASARRAGLEDDLDISGRAIAKEEPPAIEWWDQDYTTGSSYEDLPQRRLKIRSADSPITAMIQHPIPIPAPSDLNAPGPAPLMYTKKEHKKIRKQEREAKQKDKQDKQRLGLIPPDPPKVKLSNMATVLAHSTVQDPTKVEQEVRAQVQARQDKHEQSNLARALTKEEKSEKALRKLQEDESRGIHAAAWRIDVLANGYLRRRMDDNAKQCGLTGFVILNPRFNLVYVEGGGKSVKFFKKLVETRIVWTEPPRSTVHPHDTETNNVDADDRPDDDAGLRGEGRGGGAGGSDEQDDTRHNYASNKCTWIWDGDLKKRTFSAFRYHKCDSDASVKEILGARGDTYSLWGIAKHARDE